MRKTMLAACAAAATLAMPATAATFPSLTTIYVIAGFKDSGGADNTGTATSVQCSNVSGVTTTIRFLALSATGSVLHTVTTTGVPHGGTIEHSTKATFAYTNEGEDLIAGTGSVSSGVLNIESLQSGVFCTAVILDASLTTVVGVTPHIVRVNPHPGTVE